MPAPIELPTGQARARLAKLVDQAVEEGQVTYQVRCGQRVAVVGPVELAYTAPPTPADRGPTLPNTDEYLSEVRQGVSSISDDPEPALRRLPRRRHEVARRAALAASGAALGRHFNGWLSEPAGRYL